MKKALSAFVIALALAGPIQAGETPSYTAEEAAKHVGDTATVTGKVEDAFLKEGGPAFLNMGGRHPNETFTIFVQPSDAAAFKSIKDYMGKTVSVTGKIKDHSGKPEIIVKAPSDITVKEEGSADSSASASASPKK